jgi:hypothetical protein
MATPHLQLCVRRQRRVGQHLHHRARQRTDQPALVRHRGRRTRRQLQSKQLLIESRWVPKPLAFARQHATTATQQPAVWAHLAELAHEAPTHPLEAPPLALLHSRDLLPRAPGRRRRQRQPRWYPAPRQRQPRRILGPWQRKLRRLAGETRGLPHEQRRQLGVGGAAAFVAGSATPQRTQGRLSQTSTYIYIYTGAGEDNGIDHDRNQLRFPYDSTGLRSHDLHPHPYLPSSFPTRCLGAADKERGAGAARHRCSSPHGRRMPAARPSTEPIAPRSWRLALAVVTRRPELHSERRLAASPGIHTALASDRASSEKIPAMSSGGRGFFRPDRWQHR